MIVSRRSAIRTVSLAGFAACTVLAKGSIFVTPPSNARSLYQPQEPDTLALLDRFFPGFSSSETTKWLLPFTAIVKNTGKTPVKAYKFRWVTNSGTADTNLLSVLFASRPSTSRTSPRGTGWNTILQPGHLAIVTPLFVWSASKFERHRGAVPIDALMMSETTSASFLSTVDQRTIVRVRRDLKICRQTAIGISSWSISYYQASINYERDIAMSLLQKTGTVDLLQQTLKRELQIQRARRSTFGVRVKVAFLESIEARLQTQAHVRVWKQIQQIASRPTLTLKRQPRQPVKNA